RGDADPERAAAQGLSGERAQKGHRARRHDGLFLDDRGHAFRSHRGRVFRSVFLRSCQIESARHRTVRSRNRARLADIRGKDFGFGDQASTSSHLIPRALLLKNGLDASQDYRPVHLGAHDAVARAVQNGQVPAGALSKAIFEVLLERKTIDRDKVAVIAISAPIPNYPMVMQGNLAPALKDAIRKAFLELKEPEVLKSFRVQGFATTDDKAYDVLRETAKILDLDLSKLRG